MLRPLKRLVKRLLGRTVTPDIHGVAGADWYDAAYKSTPEYAVPYWHSQYYFLWTVIADRIRHAGARQVLDIGCGPGQLAECLFAMTGIEGYTGLDFSAQAVVMARNASPRGLFVVGDARVSPVFETAPHDVLVCTEVLEHVIEDEAVVERFRPGKRCLFTVPNFPFQAHVRHFTDAEEVAARYSRYFDGLDVLPIRGHRHATHIYYLCDGVRNAFTRG